MRKILISLAAGAALLGAGYAFEANATMGVAQGLKHQARQFSRSSRPIAPSRDVLPQGRGPAMRPGLRLRELRAARKSAQAS